MDLYTLPVQCVLPSPMSPQCVWPLDSRYWTSNYRPLQTPSYLDIGSKDIILIQTFYSLIISY